MTEPEPFTFRTITQTARRDVLSQQLDMAEREVVANEYRLSSAQNEQEAAQFTSMLEAARARATILQNDMDALDAEIGIVVPPAIADEAEVVAEESTAPDHEEAPDA